MATELVPAPYIAPAPKALTAELVSKIDRAVSLVEVVRFWMFRRSLALVVLATAVSAALLPTRESVQGSALELSLILAGAVAGAIGFMLFHSEASLRLLSSYRMARGSVGAVAAVLVSAIFPLHSQLWVPACGLLCLVALVVSLRQILLFDLFVLGSNLCAHAAYGDLGSVRPVAVIGLWVGIPFWTVLISVGSERVLDHILGLCRQRCAPGSGPLRVSAWTPRPLMRLPVRVVSTEAAVEGVARRLTTRQKQVALLLVSGKRRYEMAARLGITPEEVSRLIARAVGRARAQSKEQLAARIAGEWWSTGPAARLLNYTPRIE
jgi:DNA-binding CsgD family transcriptional regulator